MSRDHAEKRPITQIITVWHVCMTEMEDEKVQDPLILGVEKKEGETFRESYACDCLRGK